MEHLRRIQKYNTANRQEYNPNLYVNTSSRNSIGCSLSNEEQIKINKKIKQRLKKEEEEKLLQIEMNKIKRKEQQRQETLQKTLETVRKEEERIRKEEERIRKEEETLRKEEERIRKEEEIFNKKIKTFRKQICAKKIQTQFKIFKKKPNYIRKFYKEKRIIRQFPEKYNIIKNNSNFIYKNKTSSTNNIYKKLLINKYKRYNVHITINKSYINNNKFKFNSKNEVKFHASIYNYIYNTPYTIKENRTTNKKVFFNLKKSSTKPIQYQLNLNYDRESPFTRQLNIHDKKICILYTQYWLLKIMGINKTKLLYSQNVSASV